MATIILYQTHFKTLPIISFVFTLHPNTSCLPAIFCNYVSPAQIHPVTLLTINFQFSYGIWIPSYALPDLIPSLFSSLTHFTHLSEVSLASLLLCKYTKNASVLNYAVLRFLCLHKHRASILISFTIWLKTYLTKAFQEHPLLIQFTP